MNKAKRDGAGIPIKVHKSSVFIPFLVVSAMIFVCTLPAFSYIVWYDEVLGKGSYYLQLCIGGFAFLLWFLYVAMRSNYVEIYENGIMVHTTTKKFFSTWENLKAFDVYTQRGSQYLGITTHEPVDSLREHGSYGQKYLPLYGKALINAAGNINKEAIAKTDLGQDLLRFAPQLFD